MVKRVEQLHLRRDWPRVIKEQFRILLKADFFELSLGGAIAFSSGAYLIFEILGGLPPQDEMRSMLYLLMVSVLLCFVFCVWVASRTYRILNDRLWNVILIFGMVTFSFLGLQYGLILFMLAGLLGVVYLAQRRGKNVRLWARCLLHVSLILLVADLPVYLLVGTSDFNSNAARGQAIVLICQSAIDFQNTRDQFKEIQPLFSQNFLSHEFSFSVLSENSIHAASDAMSTTLEGIEERCRKSLELVANEPALVAGYIRKSANALLEGTTIIKKWIAAVSRVSDVYYRHDLTSRNISELRQCRDALNQHVITLESLLQDPLLSLPLISDARDGTIDGLSYLIRQLDWAIEYFPSLNLNVNISSSYNATTDLLVLDIQILNTGQDCVEISPCKVGINFEPVDWSNCYTIDKMLEYCYKPSSVVIHESATDLMPKCSANMTICYENIDSQLGQYNVDIRTFLCPSIFLVFPETYTEINAYGILRETIR